MAETAGWSQGHLLFNQTRTYNSTQKQKVNKRINLGLGVTETGFKKENLE